MKRRIRNYRERSCENCGATFKPRSGRQRFCDAPSCIPYSRTPHARARQLRRARPKRPRVKVRLRPVMGAKQHIPWKHRQKGVRTCDLECGRPAVLAVASYRLCAHHVGLLEDISGVRLSAAAG